MTKWVPIIDDSNVMAPRAWQAIDAISQAILKKQYPPTSNPHAVWEDGLLFAYLALARNDPSWMDHAIERLNEEIDYPGQSRRHLGLFGGLCGLGWSVEHTSGVLQSAFSDDPTDDDGDCQQANGDLNEEVDKILLARMDINSWRGSYDLIGGLVGFGVYFLERLPRSTAVVGLRAILNHLEQTAEYSDTGVTWHTGPELIPAWQRELAPDGYYNLGVAHGVPGIIYLLNQIAATGIERARCEILLAGAMQWLMVNRRPEGSKSWFSTALPAREPADSGLSWCYGDLGRVAILLQVSHRSKRPDWRDFATRLLEQCIARPAEGGPVDAPICHGAIGLAHIYNRLYRAEGDDRCREISLSWFRRALEMWSPGTGIDGYLAFFKDDPKSEARWEPSPGFVDGSLGIALAFLAALTPIEPNWDRMLLLSSRSLDSKT